MAVLDVELVPGAGDDALDEVLLGGLGRPFGARLRRLVLDSAVPGGVAVGAVRRMEDDDVANEGSPPTV